MAEDISDEDEDVVFEVYCVLVFLMIHQSLLKLCITYLE